MLTFRFTGADGCMTIPEVLTTGMMGKQVKLEFSSDWDKLQKTAVFFGGDAVRCVSNVEDIVKKIKKIPKFEFKKLKADYEKILYKSKSHYEEDLKQIVKIRSKRSYYDIELGKHLPRGHEWSVYEERAEELLEKNLVEII